MGQRGVSTASDQKITETVSDRDSKACRPIIQIFVSDTRHVLHFFETTQITNLYPQIEDIESSCKSAHCEN